MICHPDVTCSLPPLSNPDKLGSNYQLRVPRKTKAVKTKPSLEKLKPADSTNAIYFLLLQSRNPALPQSLPAYMHITHNELNAIMHSLVDFCGKQEKDSYIPKSN